MAVPSRPPSTAPVPGPASEGPSPVVAAVPAPRSAAPGPVVPAHGAPTHDAPTHDAPTGASDVVGVAWIVREVTHVPGVLWLRCGRLSFESTRGVLFDGTPAELDLDVGRSPRAGLRVTVGTERLRVCVVRPAGGVAPCRELVERAAGDEPATSGGADAWGVWRPLLSPQPARGRTRVRRPFAPSRHESGSAGSCPS